MTSPPYWALRDYGIKGQLGLEQDFREYISKLLRIFDELKRILKRTGSFYLNMGDTYSGGGSHSKLGGIETWGKQHGMKEGFPDKSHQASITNVIPAKSMIGIPWRVALGLIDKAWILRNDVIWHKCLGANVPVYAKSQGSLLRTTVRELARLPINELWLPGRDGWR
jgi:site-specific DNA-methyltransferase (adenine-specific)